MREIAEKAGVGVGTVYRHFPQRADLIAAVFRHEVDACADSAFALLQQHGPGEALDRWMQRYVDFIVAKRGLAASLHAGGPPFETLPAYFDSRFEPALQSLLDAAAAAGELCTDARPHDLLRAVAGLCMPSGNGDPAPARRLVALLIDGLRYALFPGASSSPFMPLAHQRQSRRGHVSASVEQWTSRRGCGRSSPAAR